MFKLHFQAIINSLHQEYHSIVQSPAMRDYVTQTALLCWKMVLQRPPMTFECCEVGTKWSVEVEKRFELAWGSEKSKTSIVRHTVLPALRHGSSVMAKGKVFVQ